MRPRGQEEPRCQAGAGVQPEAGLKQSGSWQALEWRKLELVLFCFVLFALAKRQRLMMIPCWAGIWFAGIGAKQQSVELEHFGQT